MRRNKLTNGKPYEVFFIAPGQCSLIQSGRVDGDAMVQLVKSHHPNIRIVHIDDVSQAIPILSKALSLDTVPTAATKPLTDDWPFVD